MPRGFGCCINQQPAGTADGTPKGPLVLIAFSIVTGRRALAEAAARGSAVSA